MKKYLLLTAIVVLLGNVALPRTPRALDASAEEYAVYSAVISNMFEPQAKGKRLVIQDVTEAEVTTSDKSVQDEVVFTNSFPTLAEGVARDYKARNKEPLQLKESFELKTQYVLVEKKEIEKIFKKGGGWWEEFYKRYPDSGGFISLSRPGFNAAMNQAVIYIQHFCGGLCGTGHYVLLEKSDNRWRVVKSNMVWIS